MKNLRILIISVLAIVGNAFSASPVEDESNKILWYIIDGNNDQVAKIFQQDPEIINSVLNEGSNLMHFCLRMDNRVIASLLLESGVNPNKINDSGSVPLSYYLLDHYASALPTRANIPWPVGTRLKGSLTFDGFKFELDQCKSVEELNEALFAKRMKRHKNDNDLFEKLVTLTDDVHLIKIITDNKENENSAAIKFIKNELEQRAQFAGKAASKLVELEVVPKEVAGIVADYVAQNGSEKIESVIKSEKVDFSLFEFVLRKIIGRKK